MAAGNHSLRVLAVQENPMPHAELNELAQLVGSSPNLTELRISQCQLHDVAAGL